MSTDLALNNANSADLYNASGERIINSLGDYYQTYFPNTYDHYIHHHWWNVPAYPTTTVIVTNGHKVCTCPNCDGSCCTCADCEVKRLKARVAELEKGRVS